MRLRGGEPLLGTFVKSPDPALAELLAAAGFAVLVVDLEHAPLEVRDVHAIARAAAVHDAATLVRLGRDQLPAAGRLLEAGIDGIQLAGVADVEALEAPERAVRFPPHGDRGCSTSHRGAVFGRVPAAAYVAGEVALIAQVESAAAVAALPALLAADARPDAWFIGPVDLSCDLGHPGALDHPDVRAALDGAAVAIRAAGATLGAFAATEGDAAAWRVRGASYVVAGSDVTLLAQRADAVVRAWQDIPEEDRT